MKTKLTALILAALAATGIGCTLEADWAFDPACGIVRELADSRDADYRDGAWHFGAIGLTVETPHEDTCWNA